MKNMFNKLSLATILLSVSSLGMSQALSTSVAFTNNGPGIILSSTPKNYNYPGFFIGVGENKLNRTWTVVGISGTSGFFTFGVGAHSLRYNKENYSRTNPVALIEFGNKNSVCIQGLFGLHIYGISLGVKF